jgi:hypothetical protein
MVGLLMSKSRQKTNTPTRHILLPGRKRRIEEPPLVWPYKRPAKGHEEREGESNREHKTKNKEN